MHIEKGKVAVVVKEVQPEVEAHVVSHVGEPNGTKENAINIQIKKEEMIPKT